MSWAMDELEARANAQLNSLHDVQERLAAISVRETSPDDLVTVEVDGVGALTGLWLAPGANELGGRRLGDLIVSMSALAAQRAFARQAAITSDFTEAFSDLVESRPTVVVRTDESGSGGT